MSEDDEVTSNKVVRQLETLGAEILREALDKSRSKNTDLARTVAVEGRFPVRVVAETLGVARSNRIDRLNGRTKPRRRYQKAQDAAMVPL